MIIIETLLYEYIVGMSEVDTTSFRIGWYVWTFALCRGAAAPAPYDNTLVMRKIYVDELKWNVS